jgi:hypothetical protein
MILPLFFSWYQLVDIAATKRIRSNVELSFKILVTIKNFSVSKSRQYNHCCFIRISKRTMHFWGMKKCFYLTMDWFSLLIKASYNNNIKKLKLIWHIIVFMQPTLIYNIFNLIFNLKAMDEIMNWHKWWNFIFLSKLLHKLDLLVYCFLYNNMKFRNSIAKYSKLPFLIFFLIFL